MKSIVLFASGSGTNAENIIRYFAASPKARVTAVFCNNPKAGIVEKAAVLGVPIVIFSKEEWVGEALLLRLQSFRPNLIVLAGFLLKFPDHIIEAFPRQIINIHPALLPKYGGKGMYGARVHEAVFENREVQTGITIHYVDGHYDNGEVIFQAKADISACANAAEITQKVHELEHKHFPAIIEQVLSRAQ